MNDMYDSYPFTCKTCMTSAIVLGKYEIHSSKIALSLHRESDE